MSGTVIKTESRKPFSWEAGKTTWVECFSGKGSGTGGVSFSTAEEAANAITMLNGTRREGRRG